MIIRQLCLSIVAQEVVQVGHAFAEHFDARQIYHAEMVGLLPVEAFAWYQQDFLFMQQIESELFIVGDIEFLRVNFREDVEATLGFYRSNAVNAVEGVVHVFALFVYTSTGNHIAFYALVSPKRCLNDALRGNVGTQAHVREHIDSQDEVTSAVSIA